jgi:hypothetical protein
LPVEGPNIVVDANSFPPLICGTPKTVEGILNFGEGLSET